MLVHRSAHDHGTRVSGALPTAQIAIGDDVAVTGCTSQAKAVRPGDAFVALDHSGDAHLAAQIACERGARAIISDRLLPVFGVSQYLVEDVRVAYSQLCHALVDHPSEELHTVAIAGSHGKTSIALLLDSIFRAAGRESSCQTNQCTRLSGVGGRFLKPNSAPAIAEFLAESVASGSRHAVIELSEVALRQRMADAVLFDVVCLSNLHAETSSPESSRASVRRWLGSALELLAPGGMAVLNADDPHSMHLLAEHNGGALTYGIDHPAEVMAEVIEQHTGGQVFLLSVGNDTVAVQTRIPGRAHLENCLAAAAVARVYGISIADIAKGIGQLEVIHGVMHRFDMGLGVATFVDRGETAVAKGAQLAAAREIASGRVIAVVDAPCDVVTQLADRVVATSGYVATPQVEQAVATVLSQLGLRTGELVGLLAEKLGGITEALLAAEQGDVVMISGLGRHLPHRRLAAHGVSEEILVRHLLLELAERKAA